MSTKEKLKKIFKIRANKAKTMALAAMMATGPGMAPNAEAATSQASEQPKTEQYAPQTPEDRDNGRTSYGFRLEPVDQIPSSNSQSRSNIRYERVQNTSNTTVSRQQTQSYRTSRTTQNIRYGSPEWAEMNGWVYDAQLSNGLNRLGASDGSHNGFQGAYYKADDPDQIMFLPNDPIHDKPEFNPRAGTTACQRQNTHWYSHSNHDKHGYGCPDQKINGYDYGTPHRGRHSRRVQRVHHAVHTVGAIIDAVTRGR